MCWLFLAVSDSLCCSLQHYKRDADGLCHRLVTPIICESYRIPNSNADIEDRTSAFLKAGLVIPFGDLRLGDIIGHGEFGGTSHVNMSSQLIGWPSWFQTC